MSFAVTDKRRAWHRGMSDRDLKLLAKCSTCAYLSLCGGMHVADDSRFCDEQCYACRAICCHTDAAEAAVQKVGGLEFTETWAPFRLDWPDIIWSIDGNAGDPKEERGFLIPIDAMLDHRTRGWWQGRDLRKRFGIPEQALVGLSFCWKDWLLDWLATDEDGFLDRVAEYPWDFVLAPNWSTYDNHPRIDQLLAMKRRLVSMTKMQQRGLRVVPDVAWNTDEDVSRHLDWVDANRVRVIHVNVQTIKRRTRDAWVKEIDRAIRIVNHVLTRQYAAGDTVGPRQVLVTGLGAGRSRWFLDAVVHPEHVTVINSSAWVSADMRVDLMKRGYRDLGWSREGVFRLNRTMLRDVIAGCIEVKE